MPGEITRADAIRYLSDTNTRVLTYHNHKELSAWAGVVFFYAFASAVLALVEKGIGCKGMMLLWIALTFLATMFYLFVQLALRRIMGHMTIVLPRLCCRLFGMSATDFEALDWNLSPMPQGNASFDMGHSAPQFVIDEFNLVSKVRHRARWWLEVLPYMMVGVLSVALAIIVLSSNLPHCRLPCGCHI